MYLLAWFNAELFVKTIYAQKGVIIVINLKKNQFLVSFFIYRSKNSCKNMQIR